MRRFITLLIAFSFALYAFSQAPEKMSYQAVIRNTSNVLIANHAVGMRISILSGSVTGTPVFVETQTPVTNSNGLVSIEIGTGTLVSGSFTSIDWTSGPYFIKTETDATGGSTYSITGITQLLSVPYALHSKTAESLTGVIPETDPVFGASSAKSITAINISNWSTSYSWGNHSGLYRPVSYVPAWGEITSNPFSFISSADNQLLKFNSVSGRWENWTPDFISGYTESDPTVKAINGIIKSNGTTIAMAQDGTDYLSPAGSGAGLTGITYTQTGAAAAAHNHSGVYELLITAGTTAQYLRGDKSWQTLDKTTIGLGSVENTALSGWSGSSNLTTLGTITSATWNAGAITSSGIITGSSIVKAGGTSSQFLKADGSVDGSTYLTAVREASDEFTATTSQTGFTLSQIPSVNCKVKMYINGIRISNTAYSNAGAALTYVPANNGSFSLVAGDRIQFDYTY